MASSSGTKEGSCCSCTLFNPRETTSVFLFTDFPDKLGALFKFEIEPGGEVRGGGEVTCEHPPFIEPIRIFSDDSGKPRKPYRMLSASRLFKPSRLYILADYSIFNFSSEPMEEPMLGYMYDMATQALYPSTPPHGSGRLLSAYDKLYYFAGADYPQNFSTFDLETQTWNSLARCPLVHSHIQGYAVLDGHILLSLSHDKHHALAYDIFSTTWSQVPICPSLQYPFLVPRSFSGKAIVVGCHVFALSDNPKEILSYSYTRTAEGRFFLGMREDLTHI